MAGNASELANGSNKQTSLRFLRLKNDFRNMIKSGMECFDQQAFMEYFSGQAEPRQLQHLWVLLRKQLEAIVNAAAAEMEVACSEVGLEQQLEELEALVLQRGVLGTYSPAQAAAFPTAAEAAVKIAVKQGEKQQLQRMLEELKEQQQALQSQMDKKQQEADYLLKDFKVVEDQMDKMYKAGRNWPSHSLHLPGVTTASQ